MSLGVVVGIVGGAFPRDREMIGGIPGGWPLVFVGVALCLAALVLRLKGTKVTDAAKVSVAEAREAIARVGAEVEALLPLAPRLPIGDLAKSLDSLIERNLLPVYGAQDALVAAQGFANYAAHTGPWAAGERMLYRAWSAATDGHRPEAIASMREAMKHFAEARDKWASAGGRS